MMNVDAENAAALLGDDDDGDGDGAGGNGALAIAALVQHHVQNLVNCVATRAAIAELTSEGASTAVLEAHQKRIWDVELAQRAERIAKFSRQVRRLHYELMRKCVAFFLICACNAIFTMHCFHAEPDSARRARHNPRRKRKRALATLRARQPCCVRSACAACSSGTRRSRPI